MNNVNQHNVKKCDKYAIGYNYNKKQWRVSS